MRMTSSPTFGLIDHHHLCYRVYLHSEHLGKGVAYLKVLKAFWGFFKQMFFVIFSVDSRQQNKFALDILR